MIHPTGINLSLRKPWKLQITSISFEKATRKFSPTLLYKILPFKQDIQFSPLQTLDTFSSYLPYKPTTSPSLPILSNQSRLLLFLQTIDPYPFLYQTLGGTLKKVFLIIKTPQATRIASLIS